MKWWSSHLVSIKGRWSHRPCSWYNLGCRWDQGLMTQYCILCTCISIYISSSRPYNGHRKYVIFQWPKQININYFYWPLLCHEALLLLKIIKCCIILLYHLDFNKYIHKRATFTRIGKRYFIGRNLNYAW